MSECVLNESWLLIIHLYTGCLNTDQKGGTQSFVQDQFWVLELECVFMYVLWCVHRPNIVYKLLRWQHIDFSFQQGLLACFCIDSDLLGLWCQHRIDETLQKPILWLKAHFLNMTKQHTGFCSGNSICTEKCHHKFSTQVQYLFHWFFSHCSYWNC